MGGSSCGSSGPTHTTSTVENYTIPKYLQPYITDVAGQAQAISREQYPLYGGQRIAGFDPAQAAAHQQMLALQTPGGATSDFALARHNLGQVGQYGLQAAGGGINRANQFLGAPSEQFGAAQAAQYMSPYQQAVTDVALRNAREHALIQENRASLRSAGRGSAGGSRQAVAQAMADRDAGRREDEIQIRGSERGYLSAQQQFERDRMAQQRQAQLGAQYGMQGLQAAGQAARGFAALGPAEQQMEMQRISAQERVGSIRQAQEQRGMDLAYQDFLRQRDYPKEQMGWYSGILRGLPQEMGSTNLTYQRDPSLAQQITGLGLASFGGYKAYQDAFGEG